MFYPRGLAGTLRGGFVMGGSEKPNSCPHWTGISESLAPV